MIILKEQPDPQKKNPETHYDTRGIRPDNAKATSSDLLNRPLEVPKTQDILL